MIPQISIILPVRSRTTFTTNALASLIVNSTRKDHHIILVIDKTSLTYEIEKRPDKYEKYPNILKEDDEGMNRVDEWIKSHSYLFGGNGKYDIDVVIAKGDKDSCWLDHKRIAFAVEEGRKRIKYDWIIGYADEDLVFPIGWDEMFWKYMSDKDPMRYCIVPSLLIPHYLSPDLNININYEWLLNFINTRRGGSWINIPMPFTDKKEIIQLSTPEEPRYRIAYSTFENYIRKVAINKIDMERCGIRKDGPSNPFFINRSLVDSIGGWSMEGLYSDEFSLDARFDYRLYTKDVTKLMPRDFFVLHTKSNLFINDEVDKTWGYISKSPVSGSVSTEPIIVI